MRAVGVDEHDVERCSHVTRRCRGSARGQRAERRRGRTVKGREARRSTRRTVAIMSKKKTGSSRIMVRFGASSSVELQALRKGYLPRGPGSQRRWA